MSACGLADMIRHQTERRIQWLCVVWVSQPSIITDLSLFIQCHTGLDGFDGPFQTPLSLVLAIMYMWSARQTPLSNWDSAHVESGHNIVWTCASLREDGGTVVLYSKFCITLTVEFRVKPCFWIGKRRESLEKLYELCDNSSYNCLSYAESTIDRQADIFRKLDLD